MPTVSVVTPVFNEEECLAPLCIVLYHQLVLRVAIAGWTSVMIAILAMGAVQLLSLWIIGEYADAQPPSPAGAIG